MQNTVVEWRVYSAVKVKNLGVLKSKKNWRNASNVIHYVYIKSRIFIFVK